MTGTVCQFQRTDFNVCRHMRDPSSLGSAVLLSTKSQKVAGPLRRRSSGSLELFTLDFLIDCPEVDVEVRRRNWCARNQGTCGTQMKQVHSRHADERLMSPKSIPWIWGVNRDCYRCIGQIPDWKRPDTGWNVPQSSGEYICRTKGDSILSCADSTISTIKYGNCRKRTVSTLPPENEQHHCLQYLNQREYCKTKS